MKPLEGKVALVTGAARGLGAAVARRLAHDGTDVSIHYHTRGEAAHLVAQDIERSGRRARLFQANFAEPAEVRAMVSRVVADFGRLDILVGNAASLVFKPMFEVSDAELNDAIAINVRGTFVLLQAAARHMAEGGRIIHVSTAGTKHPMAAEGLFAGIRAAGDQFALCLAHELGARGITVNIVSPSSMETEGFREALASAHALIESMGATGNFDAGATDPRAEMSPLKRVAAAEDVADVIAMLAGPDARWITAQNIFATGGSVSNI